MEKLKQKGARFRSTGDTEKLSFTPSPIGAIRPCSGFNGMFALGFYDCIEKRLLLAHGQANYDWVLWMLLSPALWERRHFSVRLSSPFEESKAHFHM